MIKDVVRKHLEDLLNKLYNIEGQNIILERPSDNRFGDYSSNLALILAPILKKSPHSIAEEIVSNIDKEKLNLVQVNVAGPGFINFYLSPSSYNETIKKVLNEKDKYGLNQFGKNKSCNIEFVSANPTGPLHIGHALQAAIGDSISRLYQACGFDVCREYYVNDCGNQIRNLGLSIKARYNQLFGVNDSIPEDGYFGEDLIEIAQTIKNEVDDKYVGKDDEETIEYFSNRGSFLELENIKKDLAIFRVKFDQYSSEKTIRANNGIEKILKILDDKGFLYQQDGATFLKTTMFEDDKDRVLIKSDGSYTYLAPDIAYHLDKLTRGYDFLVNVLGADHHGYSARLKAAITMLGYRKEQLDIEFVQMARLIKDGEEFKLSKRSGKSVTLIDLVNEIGIDAARYALASRSANSHLDIDLSLLKKTSNENPVYYAQYAHARCHSILQNGLDLDLLPECDASILTHEKEKMILKIIDDFEENIIGAALTRAPNKIALFIQKLATAFHSFYGECRVIDGQNPKLSRARLALVQITGIVLKNALSLLGVNALERMD